MGMPSVTIKRAEEIVVECPGCEKGFRCKVMTPQTRPLLRDCPSCQLRVSIVAEGTIFGLWEVRTRAVDLESRGVGGRVVRTPWLSIFVAAFAGRFLCWVGRHERGGWWPVWPYSDGWWRRVCCRLPCSWREDVRCVCDLPEDAVILCKKDRIACSCGSCRIDRGVS
jgi:hypothetical protein